MASDENSGLPKPKVEIVVNGKTIVKPDMKVYFVDDDETGKLYGTQGAITEFERVCTCNKVVVKSSSGSTATTKSKNTGGGGGVATGACSCNLICTCNKVS